MAATQRGKEGANIQCLFRWVRGRGWIGSRSWLKPGQAGQSQKQSWVFHVTPRADSQRFSNGTKHALLGNVLLESLISKTNRHFMIITTKSQKSAFLPLLTHLCLANLFSGRNSFCQESGLDVSALHFHSIAAYSFGAPFTFVYPGLVAVFPTRPLPPPWGQGLGLSSLLPYRPCLS